MEPVCLVLGAGAGIGGTVAAKFAKEGYHSYLCRRSDKEGLDRLIGNIEKNGGKASGCLLNAVDDNVLEDLIVSIEQDIGPIEVLIYNLGAQSHVAVSFESPEYTSDVNALGPLRLFEIIRHYKKKKIKFYQASSSEMYGKSKPPQNEKTLFLPRSVHAISKVFAPVCNKDSSVFHSVDVGV